MQTLLAVRRAVILLIIAGGLTVWVYDLINNGLNYTQVTAEVERVGPVCYPIRSPNQAIDCSETWANPSVKRWVRGTAVWIRYQSPADGKQHQARLIPIGGDAAVEATHLKPGDRWKVLAHDDVPGGVKAER